MRQGDQARRRAIVTGAGGGMGRACARVMGETMDLVLSDASDALSNFSDGLRQDGYKIAASLTGDLAAESTVESIAAAAGGGAGLGALVHTAGLSPSLAGWEPIMRVNLVATAQLLNAIEPVLTEGSVAILIASMAGHMVPEIPDADEILDDPLASDFMDRITPTIEALADQSDPRGKEQVSYGLSKRAVIRLCEQRAASWAEKGARIVSVSPGTIWTPMGCKEAANTPAAAAVVEATPVGRWGTVMDIAAAVRFLCSDSASFITGTDLRVDGGVTPVLRTALNSA